MTGQPEEASLKESNSPDELFRQGNSLMAQNRHEEAAKCYLRLLALRPLCYEAHLNLGNTFFSRGRLQEALSHYRQAAKIFPACVEAYFNAGNTLCREENFDGAIKEYDEAIRLKPDYIAAHLGRAAAFNLAGKKREAADAYARALELEPENAVALAQRGSLLLELADFKEAERCFKRFINLNPNAPEALLRLGSAYQSQKKTKEAITALKQALILKPDFLPALNHLGNLLLHVDKVDAAISSFKRVLQIEPDHYEALNNIGNAYFAKRDPDVGVEFFNRAVELHESEAMAHWNRSLLDLLRGDYKRGWEGFEWRLKSKDRPLRNPDKPEWDGSDPAGKTILVYLEQGFGDCMQCVRYAPMLAARGAKVLLEYRDSLKRLFECLESSSIKLVHERDRTLDYDCQVAVMSLPHLFGTTLESVPNEVPYLRPPKTPNPRLILPASARPRVGFVWKGNPCQGGDRVRSGKLKYLLPLLNIPEIEFVCLQQMLTDEERSLLKQLEHVLSFPEPFADFGDTATVMEQLDLVIAVDTGVAHLAGSLGKPLWVALSQNSSWQWLLDREDSPWYPTARLFRQETLHDWPGVYAQIARALKERYAIDKLPEEIGEAEQLDLADKYLAVKNLREAEKICDRFTPSDEAYPRAARIRGLIEQKRGNWPEAARCLTEAIAVGERDDRLQYELGCAYEASGRAELALRSFVRAAEMNSGNADVWSAIGNLHLKENRLKEAEKAIARALDLAPDHQRALFLKGLIHERRSHNASALKCLKKAARAGGQDPEVELHIAQALSRSDRPLNAIKSCEAVLRLQPSSLPALLLLASQHERLGNLDEAEQALKRALGVSPGSSEPHLALARLYERRGALDNAIEYYYRTLSLDPSNAGAHFELGALLARRGHALEADISFRQALEFDPSQSQAATALAALHQAKNRQAAAGIREGAA